MNDWPIIAPFLTIVIGIVVLLFNRILGNEKIFHAQWKIVLFILAAATFQIAILGREFWGVGSSGLIRLDGFNTHLAFCFLIYCLFSHISVRFDRVTIVQETGLLQLAFVLAGLTLIMANNLLLYVIAAPLLFVISGIAPLLNEKASTNKGFRSAILGAFVILVLFSFSAALIGQAADSFELHRLVLSQAQKSPQFFVGWTLHLLVILGLMLLPPTSFFLKSYSQGESWSLNGFFRISLPLLSVILFSKWIFLTGFESSGEGSFKPILLLSPVQISSGLSCLIFSLLFVILISTRRVLLFAQALTTAGLFAAILSSKLTGSEGLLIAQSALYIFVFSSTLLQLSFSMLGVSTQAELSELRDALQKAPVSVQFGFLIAALSSAPIFTYVGFDLASLLVGQTKMAADFERMTAILILVLMSFVTIVICNRIVELYFGNAKRNSAWDTRGFAAKMWSYALMAILLILGIYPTPLYKYLSHSINLFAKHS